MEKIGLFQIVFVILLVLNVTNSAKLLGKYNPNLDNDEPPPTTPAFTIPIGVVFAKVAHNPSPPPPEQNLGQPNEQEVNGEKKPNIDEDDEDPDNDNDNSEEERESRKFKPILRQSISCGYHRLRNGQVIPVQSTNFNFTDYKNWESCTWKFFGHHCVVKVACPCFDIDPTSDCGGDYIKISDTYSFSQKFCGLNKPEGLYNSTTNNLRISFRTNSRDTAKGFLCYVTCTGPGKNDPVVPQPICPTSSQE